MGVEVYEKLGRNSQVAPGLSLANWIDAFKIIEAVAGKAGGLAPEGTRRVAKLSELRERVEKIAERALGGAPEAILFSQYIVPVAARLPGGGIAPGYVQLDMENDSPVYSPELVAAYRGGRVIVYLWDGGKLAPLASVSVHGPGEGMFFALPVAWGLVFGRAAVEDLFRSGYEDSKPLIERYEPGYAYVVEEIRIPPSLQPFAYNIAMLLSKACLFKNGRCVIQDRAAFSRLYRMVVQSGGAVTVRKMLPEEVEA